MTTRRLIALLLALLVCASAALLSCSSDDGGTAESDTQSAADTVNQGLPVGDDTEEVTAPPVVLPTETTEAPDTEAPAQEDTPVQSETPAVSEPSENVGEVKPNREPVDENTADVTGGADTSGVLDALAGKTDSGRFVSEQSENLVLYIDWSSVIGNDGTAEVTVTVGLSHYRLFSREKTDMGAVQVDGNAVLFSTPAIEYDENTKTATTFYTATYTTARSEMEVEASWQVLGQYGGVEIDTLTVGGTIVLAEDT